MAGLVEMLAKLYSQVAGLTAAMGRHERVPEQRWGVVTTCTSTRTGVTFPGETVEQVIDRSTEAVWVGAQVLVQVQGTARWIVGLAGATIPAGMKGIFAGPVVPDGWKLRDGSLLSRAVYWRLFAAIGVTYGAGDGSSTFALPDDRGKFDLGSSATYPLAATGGEAAHALTADENGPHTHSTLINTSLINTRTAGSAAYNVDSGGATATGSSGLGAPHNNMPPYSAGLPIIKF
jgi:microcystin-dependent protein